MKPGVNNKAPPIAKKNPLNISCAGNSDFSSLFLALNKAAETLS